MDQSYDAERLREFLITHKLSLLDPEPLEWLADSIERLRVRFQPSSVPTNDEKERQEHANADKEKRQEWAEAVKTLLEGARPNSWHIEEDKALAQLRRAAFIAQEYLQPLASPKATVAWHDIANSLALSYFYATKWPINDPEVIGKALADDVPAVRLGQPKRQTSSDKRKRRTSSDNHGIELSPGGPVCRFVGGMLKELLDISKTPDAVYQHLNRQRQQREEELRPFAKIEAARLAQKAAEAPAAPAGPLTTAPPDQAAD